MCQKTYVDTYITMQAPTQSVPVEVYGQKKRVMKQPQAKDLSLSLPPPHSSHVAMKQRQVYVVTLGLCLM